jgi:magnesium chelatase family protein
LSVKQVDCFCTPDAAGLELLAKAMARLSWSARVYHRVLRVARTIADLDHKPEIGAQHIAQAIQYRRALMSA